MEFGVAGDCGGGRVGEVCASGKVSCNVWVCRDVEAGGDDQGDAG